jgi:hypothetical protein
MVDPASATILILHLISGSNTYVFPGDVFGSEWVIYEWAARAAWCVLFSTNNG